MRKRTNISNLEFETHLVQKYDGTFRTNEQKKHEQ